MNKIILYIFLLFPSFVFANAFAVDTLKASEHRSIDLSFKEKYQSEAFVYEVDKAVYQQSIWEAFKLWLQRFFEINFNFETPEGAVQFVDILLKFLYVLIILVVIYFVVKAFINKEGSLFIDRSNKKLILAETGSDESLLKSDLDQLIKEAIENHNYRLATRFYYLKTLKQLDKHNIIKWEQESTNLDFLRQIKDELIKQQFSYISYLYNYSWYGKFELNSQDFKSVQSSFETLNNKMQ